MYSFSSVDLLDSSSISFNNLRDLFLFLFESHPKKLFIACANLSPFEQHSKHNSTPFLVSLGKSIPMKSLKESTEFAIFQKKKKKK